MIATRPHRRAAGSATPASPAPRPALSPAHGTSLATTAGITAVITVVIATSVLGQIGTLAGIAAAAAALSIAALLLGALGLYLARDRIGLALDRAGEPRAAADAAAGLVRFHLGMASVFLGAGLAAAVRLHPIAGALAWIAPVVAGLAAGVALRRARASADRGRERRISGA